MSAKQDEHEPEMLFKARKATRCVLIPYDLPTRYVLMTRLDRRAQPVRVEIISKAGCSEEKGGGVGGKHSPTLRYANVPDL
jgi:hypothetical protein